jgi:uncharacterized protein YjlB
MKAHVHLIKPAGSMPNNAGLPLLVYPGAVPIDSNDPAARFEKLFESNGWGGCWRNGIFPFHHFHSTAHEVLGVYSGSVRILFGGPEGVEVEAEAGDVIIVPAGVGHRRLGMRGKFGVVGAYPIGQQPDICEAGVGDLAHQSANIRDVPTPTSCPVAGSNGPLPNHW